MKNNLLTSSCIIVIFLFLSEQVSAVQLLVQDQYGLPIKNAVIELSGSGLTNKTFPKTLIMDQVNKRFKPEVLVINQGDAVSFPNSDNIRHHVYSFSKVKPFELKLYSGKPNAPLKFENAGISVLGCNIHDAMVGYIYIGRSEHVLMTDEHGLATLDNFALFESVSIWHANLKNSISSTKKINIADLIKTPVQSMYVIGLELKSPEPPNTFQSIFKSNGK